MYDVDIVSGYGRFREYAEAIWEIEELEFPVIQARIADWLGVCRAIDDEIRLTEEGRHLAAVIVRRHRLAERFLTDVLKLPWDKVHAEAEVWETTISDQVEEAMWAALEDPETCPHGNPIPGANYRPPKMKPISKMEPGEVRPLERISEELELDDEMLGFLFTSGFHPKTDIELVGKDPQGAYTVSVDGKRVGVGEFAADRLFVAI